GQLYKIDLTDRFGSDMTIQSQFIIMFHEPSHRKLTMNYWKFWLSQQKACENARAVDGISNVTFPGFDSIAFEWNGSMGAKLCLRFHCLSTDFSRIKGVKGIPLRAFMSSQVTSSMHPSMMRQYAGTCSDTGDQSMHSYFEECFCKVRLFRDKGAERKNKDDAKQIKKQFAKMMHEGDSKEHPMWLMYNPSTPLSVFGEIPMHPALDMFEHASLIRDLNMPSPPLPTALPCHSL
ncbi:CP2 transcription factor-domain-containing protein, partial [Gongronella butleri]